MMGKNILSIFKRHVETQNISEIRSHFMVEGQGRSNTSKKHVRRFAARTEAVVVSAKTLRNSFLISFFFFSSVLQQF